MYEKLSNNKVAARIFIPSTLDDNQKLVERPWYFIRDTPGIIGFVGLVVPHIVRLVWGGDYRRLIPLSMLGGASMLLLSDVVARTIIAPQEVPVGIVTALLGAPFFLWILKRSKAQNYW